MGLGKGLYQTGRNAHDEVFAFYPIAFFLKDVLFGMTFLAREQGLGDKIPPPPPFEGQRKEDWAI